MTCDICKGTGWVCENHPDIPWGESTGECDCGAGMNCLCNPDGHADFVAVYASTASDTVKQWIQ